MPEDDDPRWTEFLFRLHLLIEAGFTGEFRVYLTQGRVHRSTLSHLKHLTRPALQQLHQEQEEICPSPA